MAGSSRIEALYEAYLRKRPRQSRSRGVVEAILVAAIENLSRGENEDSLTVHQVAERAGIGIGSLYDYFRDRQSLMAGMAAKVTEDNLVAFEALLAKMSTLPLRESVELIVDHAFATYAKDPRFPRALLRIAHNIGLMPTLAASQTAFARALADMLRERSDVRVKDVDVTAYVLTNAIMGVLHTMVWSDTIPFAREALRNEMVDLAVDHLTRGAGATGAEGTTDATSK